ncbi:hypothetical protein F5Y17DRAFT_7258 [Xylariaceae sp. FL0594]|nr:hypothetical protein F5Y17DRAFT_7258 [Xylariaceae sp. FL0594]
MESAPLIKAHDHAKAASNATHTSDTTVAINEHARAAGEFANAAGDTTSVEALRTLRLLEQHHRRLSELLQAPLHTPSSQSSAENDTQEDEKDDANRGSDHAANSSHPSSLNEKSAASKPTGLKQPRYPSRDLGASIASNLASARGIRSKYRSQPLSPSVSNTEAPGNLDGTSKKAASRSRMQDMLDNSDKTSALSSPTRLGGGATEAAHTRGKADVPTTSSDEGFSRFYSAFGSIINRISAPLAFAGLPLASEDQPEEQRAPLPAPAPETSTQKRIRVQHSTATSASTSASAEPDLQKLYSKAALRAVARDGQSTNDSFYVVPTSGHTASYASILSFADKEKRRMEASALGHGGHAPAAGSTLREEPDEDDFVDARESQHHYRASHAHPHTPGLWKRAGKSSTDNALEELYLENKSLKDMIDLLSKRLHAFESMSQNSGMRLAESMRLMRPGSPLATPLPPSSHPTAPATTQQQSSTATATISKSAEEALKHEIEELKAQNQALMKQNEELEKNYSKARANLGRYREKWEQLKAGAKARRAGSSSGNNISSGIGASGNNSLSEMTDDGLRSPHIA